MKKVKKPKGTKSKTPVSTVTQCTLQSQGLNTVESQGLSLDSILHDVGDYASIMRPPPSTSIPRVESSDTEETSSSRAACVDYEGTEVDFDEDVGRKEKRRMYLSSLRNLVTELKHAQVQSAQSAGHFSFLQTREKADRMPFLRKVFHQVPKSGVKNQGRKVDVIKRMAKIYPTTEPAESGVLQPRLVPKELRQFVPANLLLDGGASSLSARLKPSTLEGEKRV